MIMMMQLLDKNYHIVIPDSDYVVDCSPLTERKSMLDR